MSNFSSKTKYVEARPRREKKLGRGGSVVSVVANGGSSGVSKSYVDSNFVTLATEQTIPGAKDFVGGIKVNGMPITYNAELGVWEFTGDLLVTGAVTMFSSLSGFQPSTVTEAVEVDGETIVKTKNSQGQWQLTAIGGGGGTGGGDLTAAEVNLLIENALKPYALSSSIPTDNKQLGNGAGYITAAALTGYATEQYVTTRGYITLDALAGYAPEQWVGDNYLSKNGGTISGTEEAVLKINTSYAVGVAVNFRVGDKSRAWVGYNTSDGAYLGDSDWGYTIRIGTDGKPYYRSYELVHSNNIGSYNAGSADVLKKSFANENINYSAGDGLKLIYCHGNPGNFATNYQSGISVLTDYAGWQLTCYGGVNIPNPYFRQRDDAGIWRDWHQLAFLTDNVASATKLQTPRTIWGQSFDGTKDISGLLTDVDGIRGSTTDGGYIGDRNKGLGVTDGGSMIYNYSSSPITFHIKGSERMRIASDGNVAIGGTTADAKLHIHGTNAVSEVNASGLLIVGESNGTHLAIDGNDIQAKSKANTLSTLYLNGWGGNVIINESNAGKVGIGTTNPTVKLHIHYSSGANGMTISRDGDECSIGYVSTANSAFVAGVWGNSFNIWNENHGTIASFNDGGAKINGDLLTTGAITMFSQLSMKNVIDYDGLSLAQLAQIKPARFTWKDGRDTLVHAGGIADEVMQVLPEVVYRTKDDNLTMDYGSAGFFMAASLIKPVIDHEKRIADLEQENKQLKQQIKQLRVS